MRVAGDIRRRLEDYYCRLRQIATSTRDENSITDIPRPIRASPIDRGDDDDERTTARTTGRMRTKTRPSTLPTSDDDVE